jgi:Concanavalin A-like lectin/glucanases superfamily
MRRHSADICIVLLIGAAGAFLALESGHGSIVLTLSSSHGIDTGDLLVAPLVLLAIGVARDRSMRRDAKTGPPAAGWGEPVSAILVGVLLLLTVVVAKAGGPLVPAGGGTFNGVIRQAFGADPVPVDRWTAVALTYDGAALRLYVNGRQVSSQAAAGPIQAPANPLWIGGNRPYGEHFDGLIDDVRVYDRVLGPAEIRADIARPVAPAPGLAAAYAFDEGSGTRAVDTSGHGNTGEIRGATWTRGRFGRALRFNGAAVMKVPPSSSLNLTRGMTLSGWIRPSSRQSGWRTIVQRQTDAYFLTASSDRVGGGGWRDDARVALLAAAAAMFGVVIASARAPRTQARRRRWWLPVVLFALASLIDAAFVPAGTLIAPAAVAVWLAATATQPIERAVFVLLAAAYAGITVASAADIAGIGVAMRDDDGGIGRSPAVGALFVVAGSAWLVTRRMPRPRR